MGKGIAMMYSRKGGSRHRSTVLFLISSSFLLGGLLGYWVGGMMPAGVYIHSFLESAKNGGLNPSVWQELWMAFRWPAGVLLFGFLPMAGLTVPAFFCLRGFLLSYSISSFVQEGILHAILLFGPTCVLTLPVMFLLGTDVLLRRGGEQTERKTALVLACLMALCLCVILDFAVIPDLLN